MAQEAIWVHGLYCCSSECLLWADNSHFQESREEKMNMYDRISLQCILYWFLIKYIRVIRTTYTYWRNMILQWFSIAIKINMVVCFKTSLNFIEIRSSNYSKSSHLIEHSAMTDFNSCRMISLPLTFNYDDFAEFWSCCVVKKFNNNF